MRATFKKLRDISGITKEELFIDRHVIRFSNSQDAIWKGKQHFAL
jgi:hypothetical protein